jgi:hypothetical protein
VRVISYKREAALMVVPRFGDPVADIGFVDLCALWNPHKRGTRRFGKPRSLLFDDSQTFGVAKIVSSFPSLSHCSMENPALGMVWSIRHAGNRLKSIEGSVAERQEAGWKLCAHITGFFGVAIAHC